MAKKPAGSKKATPKQATPKKATPAKSSPVKSEVGSASRSTLDVLRAGGLLPIDTALPADEPVDALTARRYAHPALRGRAVVRLVPEPLAPGDDLTLEFLGFDRPSVEDGIARVRRRALGFPGWALVHDPKHARFALEVVKELRQAARRARTKPGNAKIAFDAIAARLGRSVAHFLPSFLEECGRAFVVNGNTTYAAQSFEKAREAERVHALEVDEERRRHVFLEFALAGAVATRTLADYAKELATRHGAEVAFRHFRELCLKRTIGGVPPWASMPADLRRLARAAKLDADEEDRRFLEEAVEAPSLARAPLEFWTSYRAALLELVRATPAIRATLLRLQLKPRTKGEETFAFWLELLVAAGAVDALTAATPPVEPARWLEQLLDAFVTTRTTAPPNFFPVLRALAPTLRAGRPIRLGASGVGYRVLDIDVLDLALELEIPLEVGGEQRLWLNLATWAKPSVATPERPRDPVHVAADERFRPLLVQLFPRSVGREPFESVSRGMKGFAAIKRAWLMEQLAAADSGALPALEDALKLLEPFASPSLFAECEGAHARLREIDVARVLARTVQGGLVDELGWPELERAVAELDPEQKVASLTVGGAFPYLVISNATRAIVLGPEGRALEHDLRLLPGARLSRLWFAGGQLLVVAMKAGETEAYWSGSPNVRFAVAPQYGAHDEGGWSVTLPSGAVSRGGRALAPGDQEIPAITPSVFSDGATAWRLENATTGARLREFDPATGEAGRASLPKFLEEFVALGRPLALHEINLMPLPRGLEATPLGTRDGLVGLRARRREKASAGADLHGTRAVGEIEAEGVDGRRYAGPLDPALAGLLRFPGDDRPRPLTHSYRSVSLWDPTGCCVARLELGRRRGEVSAGTAAVAPPPFWHFLTVRDADGSHALRTLAPETARALLEKVREDLPEPTAPKGAEATSRPLVKTAALLDRQLPSLKHAALKRGLLGVVARAAALEARVEALVETRDPAKQPKASAAPAGPSLVDEDATSALEPLLPMTLSWPRDGSVARELAATIAFLESGALPAEAHTRDSSFDWPLLLGREGALAVRAVSPATTESDRKLLLGLLELMVRSGLANLGGRLRVVLLELPPGERASTTLSGLKVVRPDAHFYECAGNRVWLHESQTHRVGSRATLLEAAPTAGSWKLTLPAKARFTESVFETSPERRASLERLVALARERGATPKGSEAALELASATGLTRAEAALVLAGFAGVTRGGYGSTTLAPEPRAALDLKAQAVKTASDNLRRVTHEQRLAVLDAAFPADPETFWSDASSVAKRLAGAWVARIGRRAPVPDELVSRLKQDLRRLPLQPAEVLEAFAAPDASARLNQDGRWSLDGNGQVTVRLEDEGGLCFHEPALASFAHVIPYLFESAPVGDPLRSNIPEVLERVRKRLDNPELLLSLGSQFLPDAPQRAAFLEAFGGVPLPLASTRGEARDNGALVVLLATYGGATLLFRPARAKNAPELARYAALNTGGRPSAVAYTTLVASSGFDAIAARVRKTPVPAGQWEANPVLSAPEVVAAARKRWKLSLDEAALYLQTLALAAPRARLVQTWNSWKSARYETAADALVGRRLLVRAKRERAGRELFLPGAWRELKAPDLPIEPWKFPLYGVEERPGGGLARPLLAILPLRPLHETFAEAWRRVDAGDAPAYEEVR